MSTKSFNEVILLCPDNDADGTYDATKGKSLSVVITPLASAPVAIPSIVPTPPPAPPSISPPSAVSPYAQIFENQRIVPFTQYLFRGAQVSILQKFLSLDATLYPEHIISGYFGVLTEQAMKRFQDRNNIVLSSDAGYGFVGPKTRAKLNSLLGL